MNTFSEFQVNIFSNNRDITKCQSFCTTKPDNDDAKATAIPRVFCENSQAKNRQTRHNEKKVVKLQGMDEMYGSSRHTGVD